MSATRSIALVSPHAWPAHDDITWRIEQEAAALARRGHRVTILTPARGADLLAEGRRRLTALRTGETDAALADNGGVLVFPLGRALPTGPRRRIGGPLDLAASLEDVLSRTPFDVVHIHEPLAPSPALAALRHAGGVTAATFYRFEQLAGVAFAQTLLERAMGRIDVLMAATEAARRAVSEIFNRDSTVIAGGVDTARFHPAPGPAGAVPGIVAIARSTDRTGLGFALRVIRGLDLARFGRIAILAPGEAPWRSRAAVPKALRERVEIIPDTGPAARADAFRDTALALVTAPDELAGSATAEAMACGLTTIVPRTTEADAILVHGRDGIALPPFSRDAWITVVEELGRDATRRAELGAAASARTAGRSWDAVAALLEEAYEETSARPARAPRRADGRILADLAIHPGPAFTPREIVTAALTRGLGAVAVIGERSPEPGLEARQIAGGQLTVIAGQRIRTSDGAIVGLFLTEAVADGHGLEETARRVRAQGGVVMVPHPGPFDPPGQDLLRRNRAVIDCHQALSGPALAARAGAGEDAARLLQRYGILATAGSDAMLAEDVGAAHLRMRPFDSPHGFLDALADAQPVQRRRGLRMRSSRERRSPASPAN